MSKDKHEKKEKSNKEVSFGEMLEVLKSIDGHLQTLVDAKQVVGGVATTTVDKKEARKLKKQERLEKRARKAERRAKFLKGVPYSEKDLKKMHRRELAVGAGALGINTFKMKDRSQDGLVAEILKQQKSYKPSKKDKKSKEE